MILIYEIGDVVYIAPDYEEEFTIIRLYLKGGHGGLDLNNKKGRKVFRWKEETLPTSQTVVKARESGI